MTPEQFFDLFLNELKLNQDMNHYYKFWGDEKSFHFRKNYFLERLRYIYQHINNPNLKVYDCGCGYGTSAFFLAMNGISTYGETLEFYYDKIKRREEYWKQYGDVGLFTYSYENLFDKEVLPAQYDRIIVQDTLHHLEPIEEALQRLSTMLKSGGKMLALEENGNNVIQNIKLFKHRGNKRIIEIWDERLQKNITIGNENIRSLKSWDTLMQQAGLKIDEDSVQYIRYYLPFAYKPGNEQVLLDKERQLSKSSKWRREFVFFGINFLVEKQ